MRRFLQNLAIALLLSPGITWAQITDTTTNTCSSGTYYNLCNVKNDGFTIGPNVSQGQSELLKDRGVGDRAYMQEPYFQYTFYCGTGTQTATAYEIDGHNSNYMPANFLNGATFSTWSGSTGANTGNGTISAQTQGQTANMTLTLSGAGVPTSGCSNANGDQIIVYLTSPTTIIPPSTLSGGVPSSATWDSDAPTGYAQSLDFVSGSSWTGYNEQAIVPPLVYPTTTTPVVYTLINGSYTLQFWAKGSSCSISYNVSRISGTTFLTGSMTPTSSWVHYSYAFTGSETASAPPTTDLTNTLSFSGSGCKAQGNTIVEGSTLSGNTTAYRDAVVKAVLEGAPESLRFMNPGVWPESMTQFLTADQYRLPIGFPNFPQYDSYTQTLVEQQSLKDELDLALLAGADAYISIPKLVTGPDATLLMQFLGDPGCTTTGGAMRCAQGQSSSYISLYAGHTITLELGNEAWNYFANDDLNGGNGKVYGGVITPVIAAIKASPYYSSVIKIAANATVGSGNGQFGHNSLTVAGCTPSTPALCPDYEERAPYGMNKIRNMLNVTQDGHAEGYNQNTLAFSAPTSCGNYQTVPGNGFAQIYDQICFGSGVNESVYEYNYQPTDVEYTATASAFTIVSNVLSFTTSAQSWAAGQNVTASGCTNSYLNGLSATISSTGLSTTTIQVPFTHANASGSETCALISSPTQQQASQQLDGVGAALVTNEYLDLMRQQAHFSAPIHEFAFDDFIAHGADNVNFGHWDSQMLLPCGPGNISGCSDYGTPQFIALRMRNNAIKGKHQLLTTTTANVPTLNYAGGQGGSIAAASAVNLMNFITYTDGSNNYAKIIYNDDTTAHTVTFAGAAAPLSSTSVTYAVLGGTVNAVTDNCDNVTLTTIANPCVVQMPSTTTTTGLNTYSAPANSMTVMTYSLGGTPQVATPTFSPGAGTYTSTQTVAITTATSGAGLCYTTDGSTPTSSGTACTHGTSLANGGTVSVATTQTLNAIGYLSGDTVSSVGTAAYTISTQAAAPTFSPGAGTYASAQSVTPSSTTTGATFLSCVGVGCTPSTPVSGTISVTASETIGVLTQASGYSNSTVTYAAYVINGTLPTPTFSPAAGNYSTAQSVAISDAVSGTSIYYTTNGSTPTTGSTLYTGPVAVSTNQTVQAIAVKSGYTNSSVGSAAYTFTMTGVNLNCSGTVTILPSTVLH